MFEKAKWISKGTKRDDGSRLFRKSINIEKPVKKETSKEVVKELYIDFKPALTIEQLDARLLKDFNERKNETLNSLMRGLLPQVLINTFLGRIKVDGNKKVNEVTKNERNLILNSLKKFNLSFTKIKINRRKIIFRKDKLNV